MNAATFKLLFAGSLLMASLNLHAEEILITVKGMVCGFCAQGIEKKFKALPQVESVEVSLKTKVVKIETEDGSKLPDSQVREIVKEAGYNIEKIQRGGNT